MSKFYPALTIGDTIGYFDEADKRNVMSIRRLFPPSMQERALMSLSFDERIHYSTKESDGENREISELPGLGQINDVFVDCGAFSYRNMDVPRFPKGGTVNSLTALEEYQDRHLSRLPESDFILCSPDHIITQEMDDETAGARFEFTRRSATGFLNRTKGMGNVTAVAVAHGRTPEERARMTAELIEMGYEYIAFGGLVPMARNAHTVLSHLTGSSPLDTPNHMISEDSALGIAKRAGVRTHLFGLNSPEWYRWIKRLGVDSFDGSKLSTEGAVNGIIWMEEDFSMDDIPKDANSLYRRLSVKKIEQREMVDEGDSWTLDVSEDGVIDLDNPAWEYLSSSRCTSPNCPHPKPHNCDPRVTGSIEHNMGRTILNAWAFESIMGKIDAICEKAASSDDDNLRENWSPIEVS